MSQLSWYSSALVAIGRSSISLMRMSTFCQCRQGLRQAASSMSFALASSSHFAATTHGSSSSMRLLDQVFPELPFMLPPAPRRPSNLILDGVHHLRWCTTSSGCALHQIRC